MNFSLTYSGAIVMLLGFVFQAAGLPFEAGAAENAIKFVVEVVGAVLTLVGRYRAGGISAFGVKK